MQLESLDNNNKQISQKQRKDRAKKIWLQACLGVINEYGSKSAEGFQTKSSERSGYTKLFEECFILYKSIEPINALNEELSHLKNEVLDSTNDVNESASKIEYYKKGYCIDPEVLSLNLSLLNLAQCEAKNRKKINNATRNISDAEKYLKPKGVARSNELIKSITNNDSLSSNSDLEEESIILDDKNDDKNSSEIQVKSLFFKAFDKLSGFEDLHHARLKAINSLDRYNKEKERIKMSVTQIEERLDVLEKKWLSKHTVALEKEQILFVENKKLLSMLEKRMHLVEEKLANIYEQVCLSLNNLVQNAKFNKRVINKIKEGVSLSNDKVDTFSFLLSAEYENISDHLASKSVISLSQKEISSLNWDGLFLSDKNIK